MTDINWLIYALALVGPFVQEDAAVIGAAGASMAMHANTAGLFASVFVGLVLSDVWKYWAGRLAERSRTVSKWIADARVQGARDQVVNRLGIALLVARFVPGTRIPLYVACGVFNAPFWRFAFYVALSAALYTGAAFAIFHSVGAVAGQRLRSLAPFFALGLAAAFFALNWLLSKSRRAN